MFPAGTLVDGREGGFEDRPELIHFGWVDVLTTTGRGCHGCCVLILVDKKRSQEQDPKSLVNQSEARAFVKGLMRSRHLPAQSRACYMLGPMDAAGGVQCGVQCSVQLSLAKPSIEAWEQLYSRCYLNAKKYAGACLDKSTLLNYKLLLYS